MAAGRAARSVAPTAVHSVAWMVGKSVACWVDQKAGWTAALRADCLAAHRAARLVLPLVAWLADGWVVHWAGRTAASMAVPKAVRSAVRTAVNLAGMTVAWTAGSTAVRRVVCLVVRSDGS